MEVAKYLNWVSNKLEGEGVSISFRTSEPSDSSLYCAWFQDLQVRRHLHPQTPQQTYNITAWFDQRIADPRVKHQMIELGGRPIGHFAVKAIEPGVEVNCVIGERQCIGTGVGMLATFYGLVRLYDNQPQLPGIYVTRLKNLPANNLTRIGFSLKYSDWDWCYYYQPKEEWQKIAALVSHKSLSPVG